MHGLRIRARIRASVTDPAAAHVSCFNVTPLERSLALAVGLPIYGCDPALACLSNVCVDPGPLCPVGTQNCPCTTELSCDAGLECVSNHCVPSG